MKKRMINLFKKSKKHSKEQKDLAKQINQISLIYSTLVKMEGLEILSIYLEQIGITKYGSLIF